MNSLLESPGLILFLGGLTLAIIAGGWYQTQRKELVFAFIAAAVIFGGLFALERSIVTEREAVTATIHKIARDAEANDIDALVSHFHSTAQQHASRLRTELAIFHVDRVSIKPNLKVELLSGRSPPQAKATFNAVAVISDKSGVMKERPIPRFVTAYFELEDGQWKCVDYKHEDVTAGMMAQPLEEQ
jgi:hypothetical protein